MNTCAYFPKWVKAILDNGNCRNILILAMKYSKKYDCKYIYYNDMNDIRISPINVINNNYVLDASLKNNKKAKDLMADMLNPTCEYLDIMSLPKTIYLCNFSLVKGNINNTLYYDERGNYYLDCNGKKKVNSLIEIDNTKKLLLASIKLEVYKNNKKYYLDKKLKNEISREKFFGICNDKGVIDIKYHFLNDINILDEIGCIFLCHSSNKTQTYITRKTAIIFNCLFQNVIDINNCYDIYYDNKNKCCCCKINDKNLNELFKSKFRCIIKNLKNPKIV